MEATLDLDLWKFELGIVFQIQVWTEIKIEVETGLGIGCKLR